MDLSNGSKWGILQFVELIKRFRCFKVARSMKSGWRVKPQLSFHFNIIHHWKNSLQFRNCFLFRPFNPSFLKSSDTWISASPVTQTTAPVLNRYFFENSSPRLSQIIDSHPAIVYFIIFTQSQVNTDFNFQRKIMHKLSLYCLCSKSKIDFQISHGSRFHATTKGLQVSIALHSLCWRHVHTSASVIRVVIPWQVQ